MYYGICLLGYGPIAPYPGSGVWGYWANDELGMTQAAVLLLLLVSSLVDKILCLRTSCLILWLHWLNPVLRFVTTSICVPTAGLEYIYIAYYDLWVLCLLRVLNLLMSSAEVVGELELEQYRESGYMALG